MSTVEQQVNKPAANLWHIMVSRDVKTVIGKSVNRFPTGNRFSERTTGYQIYRTSRRHDPGNADGSV